MNTAHTPGPWTYSPSKGEPGHGFVAQVWDSHGKALASVEPGIGPIADANVRLIAAAPELLETVDWLRQTYHRAHHEGDLDTCEKNTCQSARDVIAKAKGKPS